MKKLCFTSAFFVRRTLARSHCSSTLPSPFCSQLFPRFALKTQTALHANSRKFSSKTTPEIQSTDERKDDSDDDDLYESSSVCAQSDASQRVSSAKRPATSYLRLALRLFVFGGALWVSKRVTDSAVDYFGGRSLEASKQKLATSPEASINQLLADDNVGKDVVSTLCAALTRGCQFVGALNGCQVLERVLQLSGGKSAKKVATLIYFGQPQCGDGACVDALKRIREAQRISQRRTGDAVLVYIDLNQRDSVDAVYEYLAANGFNVDSGSGPVKVSGLQGAVGDGGGDVEDGSSHLAIGLVPEKPSDLRELIDTFDLYVSETHSGESKDSVVVAHSNLIYLTDGDSVSFDCFGAEDSAERIAEVIREMIDYNSGFSRFVRHFIETLFTNKSSGVGMRTLQPRYLWNCVDKRRLASLQRTEFSS